MQRNDYVFETVKSASSTHRECFFAWEIESAPYRKDQPLA